MSGRVRQSAALCLCSEQGVLRGEGGPVLPVAGLVHQAAGPRRHPGSAGVPVRPGLLQQQPAHVGRYTRTVTHEGVLCMPPFKRNPPKFGGSEYMNEFCVVQVSL